MHCDFHVGMQVLTRVLKSCAKNCNDGNLCQMSWLGRSLLRIAEWLHSKTFSVVHFCTSDGLNIMLIFSEWVLAMCVRGFILILRALVLEKSKCEFRPV